MAGDSKHPNSRACKTLTRERLLQLLRYDPEAGIFRWISRRGVTAGSIAGSPCNGYNVIRVDGQNWRASHLAVLIMTGDFPANEVDHIDCNPANDRWSNLREATRSQNGWNTRVSKRSKSGLKGAYWHNQMKKWRAQVLENGRCKHIGLFDTAEDAHAAYVVEAVRIAGEFARIK